MTGVPVDACFIEFLLNRALSESLLSGQEKFLIG